MKNTLHFKPYIEKSIIVFALMVFMFTVCIPTHSYAINLQNITQQINEKRITIKQNNASLKDVLYTVNQQSGLNFIYRDSEGIERISGIDVNLENVTVKETLESILKDTGYTYIITSSGVTITKTTQQPTKLTIKGTIVDIDGKPLSGVTVLVQGTQTGAISDANGNFSFEVEKGAKIIASSMGFVEQTITVNSSDVTIKMQIDELAVNDVVITGFGNKSKSSFTGAAVVVGREELKSIGQRDLLSALASFVPGVESVVNNEAGSNPNSRPEILIRGRSSLEGASNAPTFIMDGMEITLDEVFDMDINQIESITVLKDASAAALYGARAANGVVVITSKSLESTPIRVTYNLTTKISAPDLTDYNLLNSAQKLEYERLAGVYDGTSTTQQYTLDELYNERYQEMRRGVDTYWLSAPLRTPFSHDHSVSISGGVSNLRYMLNARYGDDQGVMIGSDRERYGINFRLSYNINQKVFFVNYTSVSGTASEDSPYGSFGDYTKQNPYDRMYLEDGSLNPTMSTNLANPMLEATYGSYSNSNQLNVNNNFQFKYNFTDELIFETRFSLGFNNSENNNFLSPLSYSFNDVPFENRGSYTYGVNKGNSYELTTSLNYNHVFDNGSILYGYAGMNMSQDKSDYANYSAIGFYSDKLDHISFANGYDADGRPTGLLTRSRMIGYSANINYMYKDKYFADASLRVEGSSRYGKDDRYSPFVTYGMGWNVHKEEFMKSTLVETLRVRANGGVSGNNSFEPYQAVTTYEFSNDFIYKYGMGANPKNIGNPNLSWERTIQYSAGIDLILKDRILDISLEAYKKTTDNLLTDIDIAPSTGVSSAKHNLGKVQNIGVELRANMRLLRTRDINWTITATASHNQNTLLEVDDYILGLNEKRIADAANEIDPATIYEEGESTSGLFVVRSAGIDPATGREVFYKRDGSRTFIYSHADKVKVGDTSPFLYGSIMSTFNYKAFTIGVSTSYRMGATLYNQTLATRVEGASPTYNADVRVFESRWKEVGDIVRYKDIANTELPEQTDRFVEDEYQLALGSINVSYDVTSDFVRKLKLQSLRISAFANDISVFSTVGQERGLDYPFARNFQLSLSLIF